MGEETRREGDPTQGCAVSAMGTAAASQNFRGTFCSVSQHHPICLLDKRGKHLYVGPPFPHLSEAAPQESGPHISRLHLCEFRAGSSLWVESKR